MYTAASDLRWVNEVLRNSALWINHLVTRSLACAFGLLDTPVLVPQLDCMVAGLIAHLCFIVFRLIL